MMKMMDILLESKWDDVKQRMRKHFNDCSRKYFKEYHGKFPDPSFVVKSHNTRAAWFTTDNVLGINPDFTQTDWDLKSSVYHETIHYYQLHTLGLRKFSTLPNGGHDGFFVYAMNKINNGEGESLVNVKHNTSKMDKAHKSFWVYGILTNDGHYAFSWSTTKSDLAIQWLEKLKVKYKEVFAFETDKFHFKTSRNKFSPKAFNFMVEDKPDLIDTAKSNNIL